MDNVVLFGFMGCGKSTVGRAAGTEDRPPAFGYRRVSGSKNMDGAFRKFLRRMGKRPFAGWNGRCAGNWPDGKA